MTPPNPMTAMMGQPQSPMMGQIQSQSMMGQSPFPSPSLPPPSDELKRTGDPRNPADQLISLLEPALQYACRDNRLTVSAERRYIYSELQLMHLYQMGWQHIDRDGRIAGVDSTGAVTGIFGINPSSPKDPQAEYTYIINHLKGDIRKFVAVTGPRAPYFHAVPKDLRSAAQIKISRKANRVATYLRSHWDVDMLSLYLSYSLALNGTTFSHVKFRASKHDYGTSPFAQLSTEDRPLGEPYYQCPLCGTESDQSIAMVTGGENGAPGQALCPSCTRPLPPESLVQPPTAPSVIANQSIDYSNGSVELCLRHGSTVVYPFWVEHLEKAPFMIVEYMQDKGLITQEFPHLRGRIYTDSAHGGQIGSTTDSHILQARITSPMLEGGAWSRRMGNSWIWTEYYMPSFCYEYLQGDRSGEKRDHLSKRFPKGACMYFVNGELQSIRPAAIPNYFAQCKSDPSETLYSQPYFSDYLEMQDIGNDATNITVATMERASPINVFNPDAISKELLRHYTGQIGAWIPLDPKHGMGDISKVVQRLSGADFKDSFINFAKANLESHREISGILPPIFGGGPSVPTARQAEIQRSQALMQLNVPWNLMRYFFRDTVRNGIMLLAEYAPDKLFHRMQPGASNPDSVDIPDIAQLLNGGWDVQVEESMPQTSAQRKDQVMAIIEMGPEVMQMVGLGHPNSLDRLQESFGGDDWTVPGLAAYTRLRDIISELAQQAPILDPMFGNLSSSIAPDTFRFDPQFAVIVVQEYLNSDEGADLEDTNPMGFQNVLLYGMGYQQAMMAMMAPPMPASPGDQSGEGPPARSGGPGGPGAPGNGPNIGGPPANNPGAQLSPGVAPPGAELNQPLPGGQVGPPPPEPLRPLVQ